MTQEDRPRRTFLTNHARVLLCIADDPGIRLRDIGAGVGITERAAHRIVGELEESGYVARRRNGRRNQYTVISHVPLPDPLASQQRVGDLLELLGGKVRADAPGNGARRKT
jgi:predicted transcriptional regulator